MTTHSYHFYDLLIITALLMPISCFSACELTHYAKDGARHTEHIHRSRIIAATLDALSAPETREDTLHFFLSQADQNAIKGRLLSNQTTSTRDSNALSRGDYNTQQNTLKEYAAFLEKVKAYCENTNAPENRGAAIEYCGTLAYFHKDKHDMIHTNIERKRSKFVLFTGLLGALSAATGYCAWKSPTYTAQQYCLGGAAIVGGLWTLRRTDKLLTRLHRKDRRLMALYRERYDALRNPDAWIDEVNNRPLPTCSL